MDEDTLYKQVTRLLNQRPRLCWHHCHRPDMCSGNAGFPDLTITGTKLIIRELKGDDTTTPRHQARYGSALLAAGVDWAIWRPGDLASGRIERELDALG
jgi:hypothetical protein